MSKTGKTRNRHVPEGLRMLHEDRDILVVDKAPGLLTMGTDTEKERTAYWRLTDYVRKGNAKSRKRIYIVHRLDRDASGVLVFARTVEAKNHLQSHWDEAEKQYLAVVHGRLAEESGTITSYLTENRAQVVHSTTDPRKGQHARTDFRVLAMTRVFTLLLVTLHTGRKNQIRVHLAESGHAIVGDKKYGGRDKQHRRLALHASFLAFAHPFNGQPVEFRAPVPSYFNLLMGGPISAT